MYKYIVKPIAFLLDPEKAHHLSVSIFKIINKTPIVSSVVKSMLSFEDPKLKKEILGLSFPSPVGLAAGFDKDGKYYDTMSALGFGFIEIGTVTPKPQDGNPKQRLFRLPKDKALINRMGFNNEGIDAFVSRLKNRKKSDIIIGGNIGKNKITPNEEAISDYEICFEKLYPYVDYFVVNVSSPNTPDLRSLQDKEPLTKLLNHIITLRSQKEKVKPVLLKIAPDLNNDQLNDILEIVVSENVDGIIATNTTISRSDLNTSDQKIAEIGNGGLSGQPLKNRSLEVVSYLRKHNKTIPIIGVGGISEPQDAVKMLSAGADLIQVYSGLIYQGPSFIKKIKKAILASI
ncbi:MAG: quinone-dependent dihydroorotate dehydrogenase [Saprospiraceae bacterium]|nr:quinone-dependent dihydroorotate dehydrogenase [Bacteroidia bacterium]NNE13702.1 quinone-dependent dihydroorotate dehydrogenase [Saprospiraceae bacterium]NNL90973.1 quinone-dependent dihydroorotate dehydrogenase [Saprospiraceae bacterium]